MINANVIILILNAIVAIKYIMNNITARNHANHEKMIKIQTTFVIITTIATTIKIKKSLNRL